MAAKKKRTKKMCYSMVGISICMSMVLALAVLVGVDFAVVDIDNDDPDNFIDIAKYVLICALVVTICTMFYFQGNGIPFMIKQGIGGTFPGQ